MRLAGFALVDTYNGDISLIKNGDDFFSNMLMAQYEDEIIEAPAWLDEQIRYPQELFNWKTEMYNIYHVEDVETFIQANEFYEIHEDWTHITSKQNHLDLNKLSLSVYCL